MSTAIQDPVLAARHGDVEARTAVAAARATAPELLTYLAADPDPTVRQAVAANRATPPQAGLLLAQDDDATVRAELARRIAALAPRLDGTGQDRLTRISAGTMALLVADAAIEVRAAIAEVVADLPDAPRDLVLRLAGALPESLPRFVAEAGFRYRKKAGRREYVRVSLEPGAPLPIARKFEREGAGLLTSLTRSDAFAELGEDVLDVAPGDRVAVLPFSAVF